MNQRSRSSQDTEIAEEVLRLLRLTDRRKLAAEEAAEVIADYVQVLKPLPAKCVAQAVMNFARGQVEGASKTFAPTPAELYAEADRIFGLERPRIPPPPSGDRLVPIPRRREDWMVSESWAAITVPADEWDRVWSREAREKRAREREERERAQSVGANTSRYEPNEKSA